MVWPNNSDVMPQVSSPYGPREGGYSSFHEGVDFINYSDIVAVLAGGITWAAFYNSAAGNAVCFKPDGFGGAVEIKHFHIAGWDVSKGQRVEQRKKVATMGSTGNATGKCDHFEIRVNGNRTDPIAWMNAHGGGVIQPTQRQVASTASSNGRGDPSTTNPPVGDPLAPNTVGNFNGWIHGQSVEGNDVWFQGTSGRWFWSGGFVGGPNTAGLADLNPTTPSIQPHQRQVVATASANGRQAPTSESSLIGDPLAPGTIGDFDGWARGQNVEGNDTWFHGAHSDRWFWSGGFTDHGVHDLADMNTAPEPTPTTRTAAADGAKVRSEPTTAAAQTGFIEADNQIVATGWAHAQDVSGNDVWFRHAAGWSWSGGFTSTSTSGIPEVSVDPGPDPEPANPLNPLRLKSYTPVYPRAIIALEAPLGFTNCQNPVERASRKVKGSGASAVPTSGVIDRLIVHWAWPPGDDTTLFSTCNSGGSCPTQYIFTDATSREFIRPGAKPASTGKDWNWRSWAVEIEPINDGTNPDVPPITDAQIDELIEQIVFLAECNDIGQVDGAPVSFTIDAEHVITDRDTRQTECPGDYLYGKMPEIIDEALRRYEERHPQIPPADQVLVSRATLAAWRHDAQEFVADIDGLLGE